MRLIDVFIIFFILADTLPEVIKQISSKEKQAIVPNSNDERGLKGEKLTVKESLAFTGLPLASMTKCLKVVAMIQSVGRMNSLL
jgi:hypothetical protein